MKTKTIEWAKEATPIPKRGQVIRDFFGVKWRVTNKSGLMITLEEQTSN
jgi:hypothetical protein